MAEVERPSLDVLVVRLSPFHSLDLVRIPRTQKYRVVFAERVGVQRRAFIELSFADAATVAKFLLSDTQEPALINDPPPIIDPEEDTDLQLEPLPLPLPPIPPRT